MDIWVVWLVVDAIGVPLQISSHLYFSALVYVVFGALVVNGLWTWYRAAQPAVTADRQTSMTSTARMPTDS